MINTIETSRSQPRRKKRKVQQEKASDLSILCGPMALAMTTHLSPQQARRSIANERKKYRWSDGKFHKGANHVYGTYTSELHAAYKRHGYATRRVDVPHGITLEDWVTQVGQHEPNGHYLVEVKGHFLTFHSGTCTVIDQNEGDWKLMMRRKRNRKSTVVGVWEVRKVAK